MNLGFSPYQGKKVTLKDYQDTDDIVKSLLKYHKIYAPQYDKASENFWKGDAESTGKALFDFLKKNVAYDVEPNDDQSIKSPAALLAQKHGDCKHYASFICGIADSLRRKGYPIGCKYRFASYSKYKKDPHHVFAVITDPETHEEYWTDPVLSNYDNRKSYSHAYDKVPYMLSSISGIGRKHPNKAQKKVARKAKRKERKANRPKGGFIKKIGGAPARNAFLLLLKMNIFHKASNMYKKIKDDPHKQQLLKQKWGKLGGNWAALRQAINQGVRVWNKHHKNRQLEGKLSGFQNRWGWDDAYKGVAIEGIGEIPFETEYIGVVPVIAGAAALLATAAPIIAALKPLLAQFGVKDDKGEDDAIDEGNQVLEDAATQSNDVDQSEADTDTGDDMDADTSQDNSQFLDDDLVSSDTGADDEDFEMTGEIQGFGTTKARVVKKKQAKKPVKKAASVHKAPIRALPGGTLPTAKVVAKKPVPRANVKLPIAKKSKTKTVNRAPFIQIQTTPIKKVDPKQKQALHVTKVQADMDNQTHDTGGVSDIFNQAKQFIADHKNIIMPAALLGGGLYVYKNFLQPKKGRRR